MDKVNVAAYTLLRVINHCHFTVSISPTLDTKELGLEIEGKSEKWVAWIYKNIFVTNQSPSHIPIETVPTPEHVELHLGNRLEEKENLE